MKALADADAFGVRATRDETSPGLRLAPACVDADCAKTA
jgi:hypothetical protein